MMTVRELLKMDISIDVYDDVTEELGICFDGPVTLTESGLARFGEVLDLNVIPGDGCLIICIDDPDDKVWERRLEVAKELFESLAGYCTVDEMREWFGDY